MKKQITQDIVLTLERLRKSKPLIHHLTNYVTVNDCANCVLAIGGSPIMADAIEEMDDIVSIASALVLNIGTLNSRMLDSMDAAGHKARERGIPVVLDPVGAGASAYRTQAVERLIRGTAPSVLRGNMSEIRCIAGLSASTKGVDASESDLFQTLEKGIDTAAELARQLHCVVAITGATDIVSDGTRTVTINNGHIRMSDITGTGCMCTSLIGSFCGATDDPFIAAAGGILSMGIAGELAAETAGGGNGNFRTALINQISFLDGETLQKKAVLHVH
ncbi:MAG: hydroxyethylthiazole kinase [Kiritimatiellales bacterium]